LKVLVISASPNIDGLTAACAASALEGVHLSGEIAEEARLNDLDIGNCQACGNGWGTCYNDHLCQVEDDFQALHARCLAVDALILVTPVYWGEVAEAAKAFLDRLRRCEATRRAESGLKGKPVIAIAAAGGSGNGSITCLASMERWIEHVQARKFDFIAINRWTRPVKIELIRQSAQLMVQVIKEGTHAG
jgi:multimeric flavodoxin WrbA